VIRYGCVPYLNALPLIHGIQPEALRLAPPRDLAWLHADEALDASLMPVVELFERPDLTYVPGIAIASGTRTDSVRLHLDRPLQEVRTVALDPESRTSNALVRVLFARRWRREVRFVEADTPADARLMIGDRALRTNAERWLDLGTEWHALTGRPFVYALWLHRRGHPAAEEIGRRLHQAKADGLGAVEAIAAVEGPRRGIPAAQARLYLTEALRYDLGPEELEGMEQFRRWYR
jgi:chorismate dehydratase